MTQRGFEVVSQYKDQKINLPTRKTEKSAGYDIESACFVPCPPHKVTVVTTGLKAYMLEDEYLGIHVRSSIAIKQGLMLVNSQGIIDADYYNNADNEGHIMVALYNSTPHEIQIRKGDRIAQGVFYKFLTTDNDEEIKKETRTSGIGSTNKRKK